MVIDRRFLFVKYQFEVRKNVKKNIYIYIPESVRHVRCHFFVFV